MSINTTAGNTVKFLGMSATLRAGILRAILGYDTGSVSVNSGKQCWVGLSSTDPAVSVTEPTDANYTRVRLALNGASDYLTITGASAANSGSKKEIKFNRSLGAWEGSYPYFVLYTAQTAGTLMAWGELTTPITVTAKDVVPLFEEDKFRICFPTPGEVESFVDTAAAADNP